MKKVLIFIFVVAFALTAFAAEDEITYKVENGVLTISGSGVLTSAHLKGVDWETVEKIVINEGITEIGEFVFTLNYTLDNAVFTSVSLPEGLEKIGYAAFAFVETLTEINLPSTLKEIGYGAFETTGITKVEIPNGVTKIKGAAFEYCASLVSVTIPDSVTEIGEYAFRGSALTSLYIPPSVKVIKNSAFAYTPLEEIELSEGLLEIWTFAFASTNITSLSFPKSLEKFDGGALRYVSSVDITAEGSEHFTVVDGVLFTADMKTLVYYPQSKEDKEYCVPSGVEIIGKEAFRMCKNLEKITLPEGLLEIGGMAFTGCEKLKSITIPATVKSITGTGIHDGTSDFFGMGGFGVGPFYESFFEEIIVLGDETDVTDSHWEESFLPNGATVYCNHYSATDISARWEKENNYLIYYSVAYLDEDHEHDDTEEITKKPSCTEEGGKRVTCSICGYSRTQVIEKAPHAFIEKTIEPTCRRKGSVSDYCEVCGMRVEKEVIPESPHKLAEQSDVVYDCTVAHSIEGRCVDCGIEVSKEIEAKEHSFSEWKTVVKATLEEGGEEERECSECGIIETRKTEKLSLHQFLSAYRNYIPYALGAAVILLTIFIACVVVKKNKKIGS